MISHSTRRTAIETLKCKSRSLRGDIAEELDHPGPAFSRTTAQLLKFHGIFQYTHRDARRRGDSDAVRFTLRCRPTGGRVRLEQLIGVFELADRFGLEGPRITSRQGLQVAGARKADLRAIVTALDELGLPTFASGGDVAGNVMCCAAPQRSAPLSEQLHWIADKVAGSFLPDDGAFREIWLNGSSRVARGPIPIDPIYGPSYLPHKFKIALAFPEDNCVDVLAQDVGLLAVADSRQIFGFEMFVGGGLGMIPSVPSSHPALAQPFAFVPVQQLLPVIFSVLSVFRDFGDRSRRSSGRLKQLIASEGLDVFRQRVERRLAAPLEPPRGVAITGRCDHLGWHAAAGEPLWNLGIPIVNGQLGGPGQSYREFLDEVLSRSDCREVRLLPSQDLLLTGISVRDRPVIRELLQRHGIVPDTSMPPVRRSAKACPALPTCRSAITEAERILPEIVAELESELARWGLRDQACSICVAGCPCGCTRSYLADIAIVGRTVDSRRATEKFALFVGGDRLGRRLNQLYRDLVPRREIIPTLRPLLRRFARERNPGESLGDFLHRVVSTQPLQTKDSRPLRSDSPVASPPPPHSAFSTAKEKPS